MNQGPLTYFNVSEVGQRYSKCFSKPNNSMESKCDAFNARKQRNKVSLVYLECINIGSVDVFRS